MCLDTKEAVNLTVFAGRTSGCPLVHLGKEPATNKTGLFIWVVALPPGVKDRWFHQQLACRETPGNVRPSLQAAQYYSNAGLCDSFTPHPTAKVLDFIQFRQELCPFGFDSSRALIVPSRSPNGKASNLDSCLRRVKCHENPLSSAPEQLAGGRFSSVE